MNEPVLSERSVLSERLRRAVFGPAEELDDLSPREAIVTLLDVYALHLSPVESLGGAEWWQHDPRVVGVKATLERRLRARLDDGIHALRDEGDDAVEGMRRLAHEQLVPPVYDWLAEAADRDELAEFIAIEGGPDADFDDLVAICQVGLRGRAKVTLAANYWDEMGRGRAENVHTELHRRMVESLPVRSVATDELPLEALERKALNGYLATNRALQPEMIGSLGLIECQAGPRCRRVVRAMQRVGVATGALPFYEEHAVADPRHGKDWIDTAVAPLVVGVPGWGPRIMRGAQWRATVNRRFFAAIEHHLAAGARCAA